MKYETKYVDNGLFIRNSKKPFVAFPNYVCFDSFQPYRVEQLHSLQYFHIVFQQYQYPHSLHNI